MPRILITTDAPRRPAGAPVLLDERIHSVHLGSGHAASQLLERLAWAISDAEDVELEAQSLAIARPPRRAARRSAPHAPARERSKQALSA